MPSRRRNNYRFRKIERLIPFVVRLLIKFLTRTARIRYEGMHILDDLDSSGKSCVVAFFHGRQFLLAGSFVGRRMGILASLSRDGELQTRVLTGLGFEVVRGSTSRGSIGGLIALKKLMEKGYHATFAVDGPRGPIHEVKPGAVYLAKKTASPVVALAASGNPAYIFNKAWDRYLLPWPFSRCAVLIGEPISFDDDMSEEAIARDSRTLQTELLRLQERADEMTGLKAVVSDL